ncbi:hypothetical protein D3C78_1360730 [compost metagenome]
MVTGLSGQAQAAAATVVRTSAHTLFFSLRFSIFVSILRICALALGQGHPFSAAHPERGSRQNWFAENANLERQITPAGLH